MTFRRIFKTIRYFGIFVLIIGFLILPLFAIFSRTGGVLHGSLSPILVPVLLVTLKQASFSCFASLALAGLFCSAVRNSTPLLNRLLLGIFSLPSMVLVGLFMVLAKRFNLEFGFSLVVGAHAYLNTPWIALAVFEARKNFPSEWELSGRSLGASRGQIFFKLKLPWYASRVGVATAQVFAFCVMSFTIVLLLGGGPPMSTLETEIFAQIRGGGLNVSEAAQFAVTELLLVALPLVIVSRLRMKGSQAIAETNIRASALPVNLNHRIDASVGTLVVLLWLAAPLMVLGAGVFSDGIPTGEIFGLEFVRALGTSFLIATLSSVCALIFALLIFASPGGVRFREVVKLFSILPLGMGALTLSLGFLLAYSLAPFTFLDPFSGNFTVILFLHAVLLLPLGYRFLVPVVSEGESIGRRNARFAARSLGGGFFTAFRRVEWPYYRKGVSDFLRLA
ncbi:MAG: iron ABC transporter permease, partial [Cryobacterium sp.]|nr:iron ABC transporter permease [Oligoflexia bacterium]